MTVLRRFAEQMRIFKNRPFTRFARKAGLDDPTLCAAIANAERGLIDADLGGGVIKQRIARPGKGKSGGFRAMILYRRDTSFSSMASRKMKGRTLRKTSWQRLRNSHLRFLLTTI